MRSALYLVPLLLTGCVENSRPFPSLLPRAGEQDSFAEPERVVPVATPDAALDAKIAGIVADVDESNKRFTTASREAEAKVASARGAPVGSEQWINAQTSLSVLDGFRAPLVTTISDLEQMAIARGKAGDPPYPALDDAIVKVQAVQTAQEQRATALDAALTK